MKQPPQQKAKKPSATENVVKAEPEVDGGPAREDTMEQDDKVVELCFRMHFHH